MSTYTIVSIDTSQKSMVIDWGFVTLNHDIPLYLLEHPEASQEEIDYQIEAMRPPEPVELEVPASLMALVKAPVVDPLVELQQWRETCEVSAFQAQAALTMAGYMKDIKALLEDPTTDPLTVLAWNKAQTFRRLSPTVIELAALLGITDEQLDDLFRFAATIEA